VEQRITNLAWGGALASGPTLILAGVFWSRIDAGTIWLGLAVTTVTSLYYLYRARLYKTPFAKAFLLGWFVASFLISSVGMPLIGIPIIMAFGAPVMLPILVVFALFEKRAPIASVATPLVVIAAFLVGLFAPQFFPAGLNKSFPIEEPLQLTDDQLADKQPPFIDSPDHWKTLTTESPYGPISIEVNTSASVVSMDIAKVEVEHESATKKRFATYAEATRYLADHEMPWVPSVQMVDQKVKVFADSTFAAIELATQRDAEQLGGGKQAFLQSLLDELLKAEATEAAACVTAPLLLGGATPEVPENVAQSAKNLHRSFLKDKLASKPVGLYTQSPELERIFQQDRFCQQNLVALLNPEIASRVLLDFQSALRGNAKLATHYQSLIDLQARMTNPSAANHRNILQATVADLDNGSTSVALFPPSGSKENLFFRLAYQSENLPNENIMNALIRAIQSGQIDLAPGDTSGWYDYQVYALETLLLPERGDEGQKLLLSKEYKERLVEAFRTILTKQRELHVKNVELIATLSSHYIPPEPLFVVSPEISVEPTATYYLRTARALRSVRTAVAALIGESTFADIALENGAPLSDTMTQLERLLYGLYLQVCNDLGMEPNLLAEELTNGERTAARTQAEQWLSACREDMVFDTDVRYIVAALTDQQRRNVRYWMTTGIRLEKVKAEYVREPKIRPKADTPPELADEIARRTSIAPREFYIPVEEFAEATGPSTPYTREEFRALCGTAGNREAIIRAVENGRYLRNFSLRSPLVWVAVAVGILVFIVRWRASTTRRRKSKEFVSNAEDSS